MKKIVALFVCLLAVSLSVRADDDRPIQFEQLPSKAQAFVKEHFPQEKVALAKMEKDFFDKKYEVIFANSSKVEFLKDGSKHDPIDTLKIAGVDVLSKDTMKSAIAMFEEFIKEYQSL